MCKIFITSDTHFAHDKEFLFQPRGFKSIQEHNNEIIRRWNSVVSPNDTVYHLGDVMLKDNEQGYECLRQLNGIIHIIPGNHDSAARIQLYKTLPNVTVLEPLANGLQPMAAVLKYKKYCFYLSHHPTITSNFDSEKPLRTRLINLCGHSHTQNKFEDISLGMIYHCEMDAHNCYPILLDDIIEDLKQEIKNI